MKIVVTCGPGYEPIDQARRLTNFSTGRLGVTLANALASEGWEVYCFKGEMTSWMEPLRVHAVEVFTTNEDLCRRLEALGEKKPIDAVFHAAALCDFKVDRVERADGAVIAENKFSTRDGELKLVLSPTFKVLPRLKEFFPGARIAGWKYELNGDREAAFEKAWRQLTENHTDACVLNGAAYGKGFAFCPPDRQVTECPDLDSLVRRLIQWLKEPKPA